MPLTASFLPATRNALFLVPPPLRILLAEGQLRCFDDLPLAVGLSLSFASMVVPFLGASALLGVPGALGALVLAARDYAAGALSPLSAAPSVLDGALAAYRASSRAAVAGHALAVVAAVEFLFGANNLLFMIGLPSSSRNLPRVRFLVWLGVRVTMISWCAGFVIWAIGS